MIANCPHFTVYGLHHELERGFQWKENKTEIFQLTEVKGNNFIRRRWATRNCKDMRFKAKERVSFYPFFNTKNGDGWSVGLTLILRFIPSSSRGLQWAKPSG
jgi:hypothetical protein